MHISAYAKNYAYVFSAQTSSEMHRTTPKYFPYLVHSGSLEKNELISNSKSVTINNVGKRKLNFIKSRVIQPCSILNFLQII